MGFAAATTARDNGSYDSGIIPLLVKGSEKICKGSQVFIDANGLAINTQSNGLLFAGVALETKTGDGSTIYIDVATRGCYEFTCTSVAQTNVGDTAFADLAANNQTVVVSDPGAATIIGRVARIGTNVAWVMIDNHAMNSTCEAS